MTADATTQAAFVLAIDHRNSLRRWYTAMTGADRADGAALRAGKTAVADGLLAAIADPRFAGQPMLLIDEEYGTDAIGRIREAGAGVKIIVPAERSGEKEFSFEHGRGFGEQISKTGPDIVKALVRYNPAGDGSRNGRSRARLLDLARWLDDHGLPLMLELLVPPEPDQAGPSFDATVRPGLTLRAIAELRAAGLSPAWWKVEGQASTAAFAELAAATHGGRCLVLGRGEDADAVGRWVAMAAAAPGFDGFAIGRTIWADALGEWLIRSGRSGRSGRTGRTGRGQAVANIAATYLGFVETYLAALAAR